MKHATDKPGRTAWSLIIAAALTLPGLAVGQGAPQPAVEDTLAQPQPLSDREKLNYGQETLREVQRGIDRIQKEADDAKKERDILKLNCLNEKLNDLRALLKVAETAFAQLESDISKAQDEAADHEFQRVVIVRKRVADLIIKASECTGEGILQSGEGQTSVQVSGIGSDISLVDPETVDEAATDLPDLPPNGSIY